MNRRTSATIRLVCVCLAGAAALGSRAPSASSAPPAGSPKPADAAGAALPAYAPLPPFDRMPRPSRRSTLTPVPIRPWVPPARVLEKPRPTGSDGRYAIVQRPEFDLPAIAFETPSPPPAPALIPGVLAHALLPDPTRLPPGPDRPRPDPARADVEADPTLDESRRGLLAVAPQLRQAAVPFLRLVIPDPFHLAVSLRMRQHPPDGDPPAYSPDVPPPKLPVDETHRRR